MAMHTLSKGGVSIKIGALDAFFILPSPTGVWLMARPNEIQRRQLIEMTARCKALGDDDSVVTRRLGLATKAGEIEGTVAHIAAATYSKTLADLVAAKAASLAPTADKMDVVAVGPLKRWNAEEDLYEFA